MWRPAALVTSAAVTACTFGTNSSKYASGRPNSAYWATERATCCAVSKFRGYPRVRDAFASVSSLSDGGLVPTIASSSASASRTASAVDAVWTLACRTNGAGPRRQTNPVRAPYVYPFSSRSFRLMRLTNCPPMTAFITSSAA